MFFWLDIFKLLGFKYKRLVFLLFMILNEKNIICFENVGFINGMYFLYFGFWLFGIMEFIDVFCGIFMMGMEEVVRDVFLLYIKGFFRKLMI